MGMSTQHQEKLMGIKDRAENLRTGQADDGYDAQRLATLVIELVDAVMDLRTDIEFQMPGRVA